MTSSLERHLSLWAVENPTFIVSCRWTKHPLSRAASLRCISPTLMQQQLLRLQEQCLSDWVRVPLTFSHFTETVLKRPSQSPDFMAEPSQGPADLMDITRINQTFMPTRSSTVGDKAWHCVERRHDLELRSVCHYVLLCIVVQFFCIEVCVGAIKGVNVLSVCVRVFAGVSQTHQKVSERVSTWNQSCLAAAAYIIHQWIVWRWKELLTTSQRRDTAVKAAERSVSFMCAHQLNINNADAQGEWEDSGGWQIHFLTDQGLISRGMLGFKPQCVVTAW